MASVFPLVLLLAATQPTAGRGDAAWDATPRWDAPPRIDTVVIVSAPPGIGALQLTGERLPSGHFLLRARLTRSDGSRGDGSRGLGARGGGTVRESRWLVVYPVFEAFVADLDRDGVPEICLGVVKPVRGDSVARRRLQVFSARDGTIRPAWLSSRLGMPLEYVAAPVSSPGTLLTIEREAGNGRFAVGRWGWTRFGPAFIRYELRDATLADSHAFLSSLP
jgi:hypothetical protein